MRSSCIDTAPQRKGLRVQLEYIEVPKQLPIGIEKLIFIDFGIRPGAVAKNPLAPRTEISLRGTPPNDVTQFVLTLVGIGQIGIVEQHQAGGKNDPNGHQRQGNAIETYPSRLKGHQFVILGHHAERHQNCHQARQRGELVKQVATQISKIIHHLYHSRAVPCNIVEQIEKCEYFKQQNKGYEEQREVKQEIAQQIKVEELRKSAPFSSPPGEPRRHGG